MITFPTNRPQALFDAFKKAIKDNDITTWEADRDGDFTHLASQWKLRGYLRAEVVTGKALIFTILFAKDEPQKRLVYAYYGSKIIETFTNHFPSSYAPSATMTPNATGNDAAFT